MMLSFLGEKKKKKMVIEPRFCFDCPVEKEYRWLMPKVSVRAPSSPPGGFVSRTTHQFLKAHRICQSF